MNYKYQLIILGNKSRFIDLIEQTFFAHISELGMALDLVTKIDEENFARTYKSNQPAVGLYFGGKESPNLDILTTLVKDASIIIPIVEDKNTFIENMPEILHPINGFELASELNIESLVSSILEGFNLLRLSRRIFISYKRNESRGVAIQLYESLDQSGFDVFLDTHCIRPGDNFQEELWHRLVDTDVVVLLNTPGFLRSQWTAEELAKANSMSIGILQLIWPENTPERSAEISIPIQLNANDFSNAEFSTPQNQLLDSTVVRITEQVESLRARSLAARQDNIITEFLKMAENQNKKAILQREKFITLEAGKGEEIIIIPTIGVPHAFSYNQSADLIKVIRTHEVKKVYILYDHRNVREKWLKHLAWLDGYLPISSIKITEIDEWLKKN
ncbi:MAG TPA: toll/interleukin-1 receptor domain-containing protein [Chitinophagaceae bacterium]|nr:toll/interleukin-1 receptor domain-containing protein [Chitinophagaceae bacterium]